MARYFRKTRQRRFCFRKNEISANLTAGRYEARRMGPATRELECMDKRRKAGKGLFRLEGVRKYAAPSVAISNGIIGRPEIFLLANR